MNKFEVPTSTQQKYGLGLTHTFVSALDKFRLQSCWPNFVFKSELFSFDRNLSSETKTISYNCLHCIKLAMLRLIKLRMEMGNVPKRQQPDHRKNNSRKSPTGLQCSEKFTHPEASFGWPLTNIY